MEMAPANDSWVVLDEHTIERPCGWFFFYNSKKFMETGLFSHRLAGNGPVFVDINSGSIKFFGAHQSLEEIKAEIEGKIGFRT
jgi:hypothetical protein